MANYGWAAAFSEQNDYNLLARKQVETQIEKIRLHRSYERGSQNLIGQTRPRVANGYAGDAVISPMQRLPKTVV